MDKFQLVKTLIDEVEQFEERMGTDLTIEGFSHFLNERLNKSQHKASAILKAPATKDGEIARLVTTLNRYARLYFKVVLEHEETQNIDELIFLIILLEFGELSKTELITHAVSEKTTGMEIIKRMEQNEMIHAIANPNDGRSKLIKISDKGMAMLHKLFPLMSKVSKLVGGNLSSEEKDTLFFLLKKLDDFHKPIYLKGTQKDWLND
jgi:MarR family transcriptional regulator, lower aerobic nicotinate degradation pathway regulator